MENNQDNGGGAFVAGVVLTGLVAVGHNLAKDDQHRQELHQVYEQGYFDCNEKNKQALYAKENGISLFPRSNESERYGISQKVRRD